MQSLLKLVAFVVATFSMYYVTMNYRKKSEIAGFTNYAMKTLTPLMRVVQITGVVSIVLLVGLEFYKPEIRSESTLALLLVILASTLLQFLIMMILTFKKDSRSEGFAFLEEIGVDGFPSWIELSMLDTTMPFILFFSTDTNKQSKGSWIVVLILLIIGLYIIIDRFNLGKFKILKTYPAQVIISLLSLTPIAVLIFTGIKNGSGISLIGIILYFILLITVISVFLAMIIANLNFRENEEG